MKIRIIVPWQWYCRGDQIDPPATTAEWLIANGYAERVAPEPAALPRLLQPRRKEKRGVH